MGTGDFICISMTGGAPWGFRLQGGKEQKQPLQVAKVRSQSKASGSGLREGDEVVSINGSPCADLTHPQVIRLMESVADSLHMLVKRPAGGTGETLVSKTENHPEARPPAEGHLESTTLQIRPGPRVAPLAEDLESEPPLSGSKKEGSGLSSPEVSPTPAPPGGRSAEEGVSGEKAAGGWRGPVVELQLSLPPGGPDLAPPGPADSASPDPDPRSRLSGTVHRSSGPAGERGGPCLRSSKTIQICSGPERRGAPGPAGGAGLPLVEVILGCAGQLAGGCGPRAGAGAGGGDAPLEGGRAEAPPPLVASAVSSEGTEPGEEPRGERDHSRPHKHRARHARLRRSESLSEKQVKEAKSRCRSIAQLLTAAPGAHARSRAVLMFKKRRRRARQFTLVSYGTGELGRRQEDAGDPEDAAWDSPWEAEDALLGASESDADAELLSDTEGGGGAHVVTFDWDSGLGDFEKKLPPGDKMEMLPDTAGKGVLMFARRRERMEQISAQQEDAAGAPADGRRAEASCRRAEEAAVTGHQSSVGRSYIEVSPGPAPQPQHNGTADAPRMAPTNRTARPFPGPGAQPAAAFSPPRSLASPTASDFPAPPPYSALTPPPAGLAQPPPWPQPAPWCPERIASRDERIAVPAKRTGILQEAKRRSTTKPMFTFKEPKVSPNPELLSLLQNSEGKRSAPGAGADSGPEEDYLSLGAEACNFMHSPSAKQKTPPPVAPKPAVKSSSSQPTTLVSPVWAPGLAPGQPPAFPRATPLPGTVASSIQMAQPALPPARPASALNLAGPFRGPQATVASVANHTAKPAALTPAGSTSQVGTPPAPSELPGMQGKGAQLFAKRQSRMEKYVVDSDTVQAHAIRAQSPTPSLPAGWKYSSNVRAPPPVAYNPIHSPSYPLAAIKSQASAPQASKASKKKGKKPLNALDVMKHQPYQLNASLFTFQPPDAKAGLPQRSPAKVNSLPAAKQAPPPRAVNASSPAIAPASSLYSVPAYSPQPAFFPEATSPASASPVPAGVPSSPQHEPAASTAYCAAPRPKFSAKKSGVAVQDSGRSLSLPGRPAWPPVSAPPAWGQPPADSTPTRTPGGQKAHRSLTPWEAAARAPPGLVDAAFQPRSIQETLAAHVVWAARRKAPPAPREGWAVPQAPQARGWDGAPRPFGSTPARAQPGSPWYACARRPSRSDSEMTLLETRSDCCPSAATYGNYNPRPRGWRRPT